MTGSCAGYTTSKALIAKNSALVDCCASSSVTLTCCRRGSDSNRSSEALAAAQASGFAIKVGPCIRACMGSSDQNSSKTRVHATVAALKGLSRPEEIAAKRGLPIEDVAPKAMLAARAASTTGA